MPPRGGVISGCRRTLEGLEPHEGKARQSQGGPGGRPWRSAGQESCRAVRRVKPAGGVGAPEWEEGFKAGLSPKWKPVPARGRGIPHERVAVDTQSLWSRHEGCHWRRERKP